MLIETLNPVHPVTIPENNLRLPDAVTIVHGPRRLLARFFIAGDRAARQLGLHLRVRHDFDELLFLNRQEVARGNWRPLLDMFNAEHATLNYENAFWVSGENANGEIVATFGGRLYDWRNTNLAEQACAMFHGEDRGQGCIVTAEAAHADFRDRDRRRDRLGAARLSPPPPVAAGSRGSARRMRAPTGRSIGYSAM